MEQNTANRLEVSGCKRSPSPVTIIHSDVITEKIGSKKAALSVSADHSRGSKVRVNRGYHWVIISLLLSIF